MSRKLPILILQCSISGHARRTEHWSVAVITDAQTSSARVFQVLGNTDSFTFDASDVGNIGEPKDYCGGVEVGEVDTGELGNLEMWLEEIAIRRNDPKWDCQDWVMDALRALKMDKPEIVYDNMTEKHIRKELEEEKEHDETGEDLVQDRLRLKK